MKRFPLSRLIAVASLSALPWWAAAHDYTAGSIAIGHPFARTSVKGQANGAGYLRLDNKGTADDKLLSVTADVSASVELHSMKMDGDIARMRQVDVIEVPAGKSVALEPSGLHIMFVGLKAPLKAGAQFPATLKFEKAGEVKVDFKVENVGDKHHGH